MGMPETKSGAEYFTYQIYHYLDYVLQVVDHLDLIFSTRDRSCVSIRINHNRILHGKPVRKDRAMQHPSRKILSTGRTNHIIDTCQGCVCSERPRTCNRDMIY